MKALRKGVHAEVEKVANQWTVGTGKTSLASAVIDRVREREASSLAPEGLAFFYCQELDSARRQTASPLLLSLIRQLLPLGDKRAIGIVKELAKLWEDVESGEPEPSWDVLAELLLATVGLHPATTVVLDGLDRLAPQALSDLATVVGLVPEARQGPFRLFLASKDCPGLSRFGDHSALWYRVSFQHWRREDDTAALPVTYLDIERVVVQEWREIPPAARDEIVRASEGVCVPDPPTICFLTAN